MASNDASMLAEAALPILRRAGAAILQHYATVDSIKVSTKADRTPLTAADLASHELISSGLAQLTPGIPVLSEEAEIPALVRRQSWSRLWMLDPLDGTREFIDANDQFCINLALIENNKPTLGLIYAPVQGLAYLGIPGAGAWRIAPDGERTLLNCRQLPNHPVLISSSRRFTDEMLACEAGLKNHFGKVHRLTQGSAMKFCRVAEGEADIYPCFGPTSEWDTAAGEAIVEAAGGVMRSLCFKPFHYNQRDTMLNGGFFLLADTSFDWQSVLRAATAA